MIKASDILGTMVDHMTPDNWTKGTIGFSDKHCLRGHEYCAISLLHGEKYEVDLEKAATLWEFDTDKALQKAERHILKNAGRWGITAFNDDPSTSFEDVFLAVKKAYAEALENES